MTWIKICGTTNLDDAKLAVDAGADALGFVFYEKSPRSITPEVARQIVEHLPETVEKVGVFVDQGDERWVSIVNGVRLTAVQWHAAAGPGPLIREFARHCFWREIDVYPNVPFSWFKSPAGFSTSTEFEVGRGISAYVSGKPPASRRLVLDSGNTEIPGGTGKTFDWATAVPLTEQLRQRFDLVIAGGLTPANVTEAISKFRPFGVDVVSGVEARPGKKDPQKVRAFIQAVRLADQSA